MARRRDGATERRDEIGRDDAKGTDSEIKIKIKIKSNQRGARNGKETKIKENETREKNAMANPGEFDEE